MSEQINLAGQLDSSWTQIKGDDDEEDRLCICDHTESDHFVLGCTRCDCVIFETWNEIDAERAATEAAEGKQER